MRSYPEDGPQIRISVSFAVLTTLALLLDKSGITGFAVLCVALHELGHLAMMRLRRVHVAGIYFQPFGMEISIKGHVDYRSECLISLAGPLTNVAVSAVCMGFYALAPSVWLANFGVCSLLLGGFHLLPVKGLDGGNAILSFFACTQRRETAERLVQAVSYLTIALLFLAGVGVLLVTKYNVTVLALCVYLALLLHSERRGIRLKSLS